ncbi:hypothetical protein MSAN_00570200 [Mycena sanguinolenta]|uniref:F-box domain-containing protein n=1 Tax=Mycena sanguinolenta TaxID=230812 RepID=A0A8H6Z782_9AGAR|nr:hypothetical protein MSAN_00570200 [Mycena sanguinolenta]
MFLYSSPFADRLNTNYVPSDSEVLHIHALLLEPTAELARVDARIEELEIILQQLKAQRALLKTPIDAHRALISPMRRIPEDVLIEIFCACLPSEHNARIDPAEAPMALGRICKHWRGVAYSAPILWSTIHIPLLLNYTHAPPQILSRLGKIVEKIVEKWLKRSATCPLSVSLSVSFLDDDNRSPELNRHPLVLLLLPFSQRLRRLTLNGDPELLRPLLQLGSEDLPLLESLVVECNACTEFPNSAFNLSTLRNIGIRMSVPIDPRSLPLRWGQLTKLRLECTPVWTGQIQNGGLDLEGAFNVLRKCSILVHCEIAVTLGSGDADSILNTSPIILPHLQTLALKGQFFFKKWIPYLIVPNLRSLQVREEVFENDTASCFAQDRYMSVTIESRHFTSSGVEDLFRSFPMITHLRLFTSRNSRGVSWDDEFLASLSSPHNPCPMLTNIIIPEASAISDAALLAFVKARMAMSTPLQQIQFRFPRRVKFNVLLELQPFIADGLEVDIKYPPILERQFISRQ